MYHVRNLIFVLPLLGVIACGSSAPPPSVPSWQVQKRENEPGPERAAAKDTPAEESAPEPTYPEIEPKDLGTINGKPASFKHAYITMSEGPGSAELQAFTYHSVAASEVCPNGLRFISEGMMLQVTFLDQKEMKDLSRFYLQTDKPDVKITEAVAKLRGDLKPGTKVPVEVAIEGSNQTRLQGVIEAVVCHPPKAE